MPHLLVPALCSVALLAALGAPPTRAADPWEIVSQAETFRRTWLEQTDSLDVCTLSAANGFDVYAFRRRPLPFGWAVIDMRVTGLLVGLPPAHE